MDGAVLSLLVLSSLSALDVPPSYTLSLQIFIFLDQQIHQRVKEVSVQLMLLINFNNWLLP